MEPEDVRDITMAEFQKELELLQGDLKQTNENLYRNPLIGIYQWHFVKRADDVCNFKVENPKGHNHWD